MYTFLGIHYSRWAWLFSPLSIFIRINIYPNSTTSEYFNSFSDKSIIYVLPKMSLIDIIVLNKTLGKLKQKKVKSEAKPKRFRFAAILALKPRTALFHNENKEGFVCDMLNLIRHDPRTKEKKFIFMPLSVFWSRAAERGEKSFLLRSLFPDDGTGNGLQKLLMLVLHRGEVNVFFGKGFDLTPPDTEYLAEDQEKRTEVEYHYVLKIRRLFNIEFAKERTAAFGPALYDKDKINQWILSTHSTKHIVDTSENPLKTKKKIIYYISEIAAKYNYMTVRALEKIFDFLWNNVFDGVKVRNFESIERYAKDGQIIWTPSHRSHFDYLLLSYVLFKKGLVTPHVAAGINLNFWPIGAILRLGGAFFIRRSFAGNKVYANTFSEYVNFLLQNSFPIEFFQEGGRSRIGKLLSPKLGMLSICVQSIISRKAENTYFIPVYFGYDKVMEDDSYARELRGAKKQKENAFQFLNGIRKIFSNYGSVDVSFGEPIRVADAWSDYYQKLKRDAPDGLNIEPTIPKQLVDISESHEHRDPKINGFVKHLSKRINQKINCAATASSTALLSTALLARKNPNVDTEDLKFKIILLHWFANKLGELLSWRIATNSLEAYVFEYLIQKLKSNKEDKTEEHTSYSLEENSFHNVQNLAEQYLKMGERWKLIVSSHSQENSPQKIYTRNTEKEFNLWWYRGTTFHVFAAFSFIAYFLLESKNKQDKISIQSLNSHVTLIRHLWQEELYWDSKTSSISIVKSGLSLFESLNFITLEDEFVTLVHNNNTIYTLQFILDIIQPERELYGIQAAAARELLKQKSAFTRDELMQKTLSIHSKAFSQDIVSQPSLFSKVFAHRTFDAYYKHKVYIPAENLKITVDTSMLGALEEFLEVKKFLNLV